MLVENSAHLSAPCFRFRSEQHIPPAAGAGGTDDELQHVLDAEQQAEELSPAQPAQTAAAATAAAPPPDPPGSVQVPTPTPVPPPGEPPAERRVTNGQSNAEHSFSGKLVLDAELPGKSSPTEKPRLSRTLTGTLVKQQPQPGDVDFTGRDSTPHCCSSNAKHRFMIDPFHPFNAAWDVVLSVLCIYVAISIPFRIGFQVELCPSDAVWWVEVSVLCASFTASSFWAFSCSAFLLLSLALRLTKNGTPFCYMKHTGPSRSALRDRYRAEFSHGCRGERRRRGPAAEECADEVLEVVVPC